MPDEVFALDLSNAPRLVDRKSPNTDDVKRLAEGWYRCVVVTIGPEKLSGNGKPRRMIRWRIEDDESWYDGSTFWGHLYLTEKTLWRWGEFLSAAGFGYRELVRNPRCRVEVARVVGAAMYVLLADSTFDGDTRSVPVEFRRAL